MSILSIDQCDAPRRENQRRGASCHLGAWRAIAVNQFTLGLIQMRCDPQPTVNMDRACERIRQAAEDGADIICLPELFLSHYFCQKMDPALFDLAESIPGPSTETLGKLARSLGKVIVASLFERRAAGIYHNTAVVLDADGQLAGHVSQDAHSGRSALFREVLLHAGRSGLSGLCHALWAGRRAGVLGPVVSGSGSLTALQGADVLVYPTAIGWHPHEREQLGTSSIRRGRSVQRGHAVANGVFVAAVNRVGHEGPADGRPRLLGRPASSAIRWAAFWPAPRTTRKKCCW